MKPKVYVETSVASYMTSRPSRDLLVAAHQQVTREWWDTRRDEFDLFVSPAVIREVAGGDQAAAAKRLDLLRDIPIIEIGDDAKVLARELVNRVPLPPKAEVDAMHIAVAALGGIDYLLTWNCSHLANAALRRGIEAVCRQWKLRPPIICTPDELMGEQGYVERPDR